MGTAPKGDPDPVGRLSAVDLFSRLKANDPLTLLDVREPFERSYCAIADLPSTARDLFIPMREIQARLNEIQSAAGDAPIVVYCHHGVRSMAVAQWVASQGGGPVFNLEGGIDAWSLQVDPAVPRY